MRQKTTSEIIFFMSTLVTVHRMKILNKERRVDEVDEEFIKVRQNKKIIDLRSKLPKEENESGKKVNM